MGNSGPCEGPERLYRTQEPGGSNPPSSTKASRSNYGGPDQVESLSTRPRTDGRLRPMTAKEKLLERVMTLSEAEAEDALRLLDARRDEAENEWGNLSRVDEFASGDSMRRLAESERAAGHAPW